MTAANSTRIIRKAAALYFLFSVFCFLAVPAGSAHAQGLLPPCSPVPTEGKETCTFEHLIQLLVNIYNFALGLAAFIAMAFIIFGGIRMIGWAMLENPQEELLAGKRTVLRAMVGFIIILTAYLTVNTVLTLLGIDDSSQVGQLLNQFGF